MPSTMPRRDTCRPTTPPTGSWWVDRQTAEGTLPRAATAEAAARMIRADSSKTSHGGDQ